MTEAQQITEWLTAHKDAEVIVTDTRGIPVRAEYRTLSGGQYPVAYLYPDGAVNL